MARDGLSEFYQIKIFQDASSPEVHNMFYSNGVAILSSFHDIPQNISVRFTNVWCQLQGQGPKP